MKAQGGKQQFSILHPSSFNLRWRVGTLPVVLLALIAFAWFAYVTWFPKPPAKPDTTWKRIVETGEFRIGIDPSFPPFESDDGKGNLSGLDIALAAEMVRQWSNENEAEIRVVYVYTGFDGLYDALKAGQFDAIISALPYNPKMTEDVRFSHSYFNGGPVIAVRESDTTTKTYYDLQGKNIGVELGSTGDSFARRWQRRLKYDVRWYNMPADALRALQLGQVDGVFTDPIALGDFVRPSPDSGQAGGVKTIGAPLVNELVVIAVRKGTPTLLEKINRVIDDMKGDGRMDKLYAEWL